MLHVRTTVLSCLTAAGLGLFALAPAALAQEASASAAVAGVYKLDPTHAALLWSVKHNNGLSHYTARFGKLEATLKLDPAHIETSKIEVTIDPTSVDVPYPADYKASHAQSPYGSWPEEISRDAKMLNSDKFPKITFTSTSVKKTGETTADVTGDLTFLGVTKPVTLKATLNGAIDSHPFAGVPAIGFAAEGTFDRTAFGQPVGFVGKDVTIRFDGEFIQDPSAK
ncbi:YceI family protein [Rhizobium paknamense]|uniref:Polyisoprenoid-binding protein YceI n=1 Tax=Rhizobium paknamense TaxID=1206817 RepID=A0ABU0ICU7_9HYPH|nr:YceI family protein [Rhizobium paknamense]MDQ0455438.1 polyisoprenoid-binding protein YceI [Rhizobium paknamense]